jgi:hypothetical protein
VVLAAPELVVSELVELRHQVEIAPELQHRMLTDGVVRGQERAES